MVRKKRSILPRPWGRPTVEWMIRDAQLNGSAFKMMAGEVGAVVDVENVGNAAHRPRGIGLAPDRLPEREGRVHRGRGTGKDCVSADRARVVVDHDREPGAIRLPARGAGNEDVEFGVIGLPDLVGAVGSAAVHQLVPIAIRGGSIQRERHERRIEGLHNISDGGVARHRQAPPLRFGADKAMQRRERWPRPGQREALDERNQFARRATSPRVGSRMRVECSDAVVAVELLPALQRAQADPGLSGKSGERYLVLDMKSKNPPPLLAAHRISTW